MAAKARPAAGKKAKAEALPSFDEVMAEASVLRDSAAGATPATALFAKARTERGHRRREAILKAATEEFLVNGFQGASLRTIIAKAGGSPQTLYRQFGNKAGLYAAVVGYQMWSNWETYLDVGLSEGAVEEELKAFAMMYATSFLRSDRVAFYRMTVVECANMPDMSIAMWEHGRVRVEKHLERYLTSKVASGHLEISDTGIAARHFLEMAKGALLQKKMFTGVEVPLEEIERNVTVAIEIFLRGTQARSHSKANSRRR